jgi:serine/threonine protein kinase
MKPEVFGRYLLLDRVAAGGMAEVWRAKVTGEDDFQRIMALKKILAHVAEDEDFITMFKDEAKITVQLQHSNIGQVYDFSKVGEVYYIAMEYISGKDLKTLWNYNRQRKTTMPIPFACHIVQKMADGLDYAHRKKDNFGTDLIIVHRDVSPQNVLISWDGEVKVIDFGIAKAANKAGRTQAGILKGKFGYMAPEQIRGLPLDGRADVFALGVVLYEMVTGERGFQAESDFSLLEMVRNVEIKPPTLVNSEVPPEVERIIFKALAKDRDDRYPYASDLSEDLQRYLLAAGKPPNRHDIGAYVRENFTVDYDKERLRLESYREVKAPPPPKEPEPEPSAPMPAAPPPPDPAMLAVQAAMGLDVTGTFAPSQAMNDPTQTNVQAPGNSQLPSNPVGQAVAGNSGVHVHIPSREATNPYAAGPGRSQTNTGIRGPMDRTNVTALAGNNNGGTGAAKAAVITVLVIAVLVGIGIGAYFMFFGKDMGTLVVNVNGPKTANVRLDGTMKGVAKPSLTLSEVPAGAHILVIEKEGWHSFTTELVIKGKQLMNVAAKLKPVKKDAGKLKVKSDPPGADIILDGEVTEKVTPAMLDVVPGIPHKVELKLKDYHSESKDDITLEESGKKEISLTLKPLFVKIRLRSEPEGASVKSGSKDLGETPYVFKHNPADGYPKITFSKSGCEAKTTSIPFDEKLAEQDGPLIRLTCD